MKRKIARRRLKRKCIICDRSFAKGDIYYLDRKVYFGDVIVAFEYVYCPKCKYREEESEERFQRFKEKCYHPITRTIWSYIPGEAVMEPDYEECFVCKGKIV